MSRGSWTELLTLKASHICGSPVAQSMSLDNRTSFVRLPFPRGKQCRQPRRFEGFKTTARFPLECTLLGFQPSSQSRRTGSNNCTPIA